MNNYDIMYRWGMTSSMHSAFIRSQEGSSVINKEEQRRKVQRHPSLLLSDLSTNLLASAACPQPGTAAGASPLLFPERRLPVGSVRLLLLGREGDQDLCLLPAREREEVPWLLPRRVREVRRIRLRGWQRL